MTQLDLFDGAGAAAVSPGNCAGRHWDGFAECSWTPASVTQSHPPDCFVHQRGQISPRVEQSLH